MRSFKDHLIPKSFIIKDALKRLDNLAKDAILFVVDDNNKLLGSLTDGDVRRGLLKNKTIDDSVTEVIQANPKFIRKDKYSLDEIINDRENNFKVIPVLNEKDEIINVINFRLLKSYLPIDVVIMAGGKGKRLQPLTNKIPKPLLPIGEKPIIEHNIDRLALFGIDDFWISVNYLGEKIENYFENNSKKNISIKYVWENQSLGTIGAVSKINNFKHDYVLITNSDILTNLNYEDFFIEFINKNADLAVLTIPYNINVPYAVLETSNGKVIEFKEKPSYTYYSNGGIYLVKKSMLKYIPKDNFFDATDFMQILLDNNHNVISIPFSGYWLDIGKHEDYEKAQLELSNINFK